MTIVNLWNHAVCLRSIDEKVLTFCCSDVLTIIRNCGIFDKLLPEIRLRLKLTLVFTRIQTFPTIWSVFNSLTQCLTQSVFNGGLYHIETSPLICRANQRTGFYMIGTSVKKKLKLWIKFLKMFSLKLTFEAVWPLLYED